MPNAYGYARVSSAKQRDEGLSLEAQRENLPKIAADRFPKHEYAGTFWDAQSASSLPFGHRRAGRQVSDLLQRGDVLVVVKGDRIFRGLHDHVNSDRLFKNLGVTVYLHTMNMCLGYTEGINSAGKMCVNIMAVYAEFESELISCRVREVREYIASQGKWPYGGKGVAPLGWYVAKDRRIYPDVAFREQTQWLLEVCTLNCFNKLERVGWLRKNKIVDQHGRPWTLDKLDWAWRAMKQGWPCGHQGWVLGPDGYGVPPNHPSLSPAEPDGQDQTESLKQGESP